MPASQELDRIRPGPGRPCTICEHPDREDIDDDLRCGVRYRSISQRYSIDSEHSLGRHARSHLKAVPAPPATQDATDPERLKARILELEDRIRRFIDNIERSAAHAPVTVAAMRELRMTLDLLARIGGQLDATIVVVTAAHEDRLGAILRLLIDEVTARRDEPAEALLADRRSILARAVEATS